MMDWPFTGLERGKYGAILADPPWQYNNWADSDKAHGTANSHYNTMPAADIDTLPVADLAAKDCVLFMWACWPNLPQSLQTVERWGFEYKTCAFAWLKADPYKLFALEEDVYMGLGYWTRANSEVCLLATRGKPKRLVADVRQGIIEPRREHSRKPDCVHDRIERLVSGPYCELFSRTTRKGWDMWGNQVGKFESAA